ncbi:hypothetical protein ACJRW5_23175 [Pseudomonas sp. SH1-B]
MSGVQLQPLADALREVVLGQKIIHADMMNTKSLVRQVLTCVSRRGKGAGSFKDSGASIDAKW